MALLLGVPFAISVERSGRRVNRLGWALGLAVLMVPLYIVAESSIVLLGPAGRISRPLAALLGFGPHSIQPRSTVARFARAPGFRLQPVPPLGSSWADVSSRLSRSPWPARFRRTDLPHLRIRAARVQAGGVLQHRRAGAHSARTRRARCWSSRSLSPSSPCRNSCGCEPLAKRSTNKSRKANSRRPPRSGCRCSPSSWPRARWAHTCSRGRGSPASVSSKAKCRNTPIAPRARGIISRRSSRPSSLLFRRWSCPSPRSPGW